MERERVGTKHGEEVQSKCKYTGEKGEKTPNKKLNTDTRDKDKKKKGRYEGRERKKGEEEG